MKIGLIALLFILIPLSVNATPEFSERTGEGCKICHISEEGGSLTEKGVEFAASGYKWPPAGGYRILSPAKKTVRLFVGFLHITGGFLWFGTILYVHILLRPAYALKGLPKGEVILGISSMSIVGITGVLLTISRIRSLNVLWESHWGFILLIKIIIYITMISSAIFIVHFVGPNLMKPTGSSIPSTGDFNPETLSHFDGKAGQPAFIAYKEKVYDVSGNKFWKSGIHMKHKAGMDMTSALSMAPHGEEKLSRLQVIGSFNPHAKPLLNFYQKAFYFVAYMNLSLVFFTLFIIALWRWWA